MSELLAPVLGLASRLRGERGWFAGSLACTLGVGALAAVATTLSSLAVSRAVADLGGVGAVLLGLAAALVAYGVMLWAESWVSHALAYRVLASVRSDLHAALARVAPVGLGHRRTGDVVARTMGDVEVLEWFYAHTAAAAIAAVLLPSAALTVLVALAGPAALLLLIPVALLVLIPLLAQPAERRAGAALRTELSGLKTDVLAHAESLRDLVLSGAAGASAARVEAATRSVQRAGLRVAVVRGLQAAVLDAVLAGASLLAVVWLVGAYDRVDPVLIPVISALTGAALAPVSGLAAMLTRLGEISAAAARCTELLDAPDPLEPTRREPACARTAEAPSAPEARSPERTGGDAPASATASHRPGGRSAAELVFDDVSFAYPDGEPVLHGASFTVPAGTTVALVGASGAGKSTCAHLAVRFADAASGRVLVAGRDVRTLDPDEVRDQVGLVPQHGFVFAGSALTNLRIGRPEATREECEAVLAEVGLSERIAALPGGIDGDLGERGSVLSGGERQRIGLARALLADRPVLVMDEPLASVDAHTEVDVLDAAARLRAGRTTLLIAHRPAGILAADSVVFLDGGRVAGAGTHAELLSDPRYRRLLAEQSAEADPLTPSDEKEVTHDGDHHVR